MTRREIPLDAARILQELSEHDVSYVVIGGLAVQAHGHTRTTQDINLVPAQEGENLERLAAALAALGVHHAGREGDLTLDALLARLQTSSVVSLDTRAGGVDIHFAPPGAAPYADLAVRAMVIEVLGVSVAIAARDDLIAMKRASGRPIDRGDVIALTQAERGV